MPKLIFMAGNRGSANTEEEATGANSFSALVDQHAHLLFRVALAVTRNAHDAEDAVQEAFLQVYRGQNWNQIQDPRAYLARAVWRSAVRQKKPRLREQELPLDLHSFAVTPEDAAIDRQMQAWLHSRIDALPEKLRQPLALAALGEWKLTEVAQILGLPEGTVRRRIHSARNRLREQLAERSER